MVDSCGGGPSYVVAICATISTILEPIHSCLNAVLAAHSELYNRRSSRCRNILSPIWLFLYTVHWFSR